MGKGKKKGAKGKEAEAKPEEPSLSPLSLDTVPSTSTAPPEAAAPKPMEPKPEPVEEEDEGGLGLGLGKGRKKRPKKKKESTPEQSSSQSSAQTLSDKTSTEFPTLVPVTSPVAKGPWGSASQSTFQSGPVRSSPPGFPGPQSPGDAGQISQPTQPGFPGSPQAGPSQQPSGYSPQRPGYPPQQPGYPPVQSRGWGRGRGQTQSPPMQTRSQPLSAQGTTSPVQIPAASKSAPVVEARPDKPGPYGPMQPPQGFKHPSPPSDVQHYRIPPKFNSVGNVLSKKLMVLANYLPMTIQPLKIYRYDVTFKPDKPKKMIPRAFMQAKQKVFSTHLIAFDQMKNCYCLHPLPNVPANDRFCINVELFDNNGKSMKFEVSFKATGIVDLATILNYMKSGGSSLNPPTEAIQCIDVILRQGTLENYIKAGRQFFRRPAKPIDLGEGLEMWTGLFQSAIFTSTAFINIDVAHKGFPKQQSLIQAIQRDFRLSPDDPILRQRGRGVENFTNFIKGLRVVATVGGDTTQKGQKREFICNELVEPANKMSFTMTDSNGKQSKMTVADYFTKTKGIRLKYPNQNCMWVGPKDKDIYYPIELLEISYGQALNRQLNEMQLSTMVKEAATRPDERKRKIEEVISDMKYSRNPDFKRFGLEIKNEFVQLPAKILKPPDLDVGIGRTIQPVKGAWQANRLLKPEALESWGFIAIEMDPYASNGEQIISLLKSVGCELGMRVSEPRERHFNLNIRDLRDVLLRALEKDIKFLVIVVPTRGRDYYHKVKQMAERDVGILTQCIKENTASRRMNNQTARNILLKVNSKLMGINQALDQRCMPRCLAAGGVMVVGADVTHPSPDQSSVPSIAAVTASIDNRCFIYNIQLSVQTPKKEMIVEFEDMMVEHLKVYNRHQGSLPRKIFVFRDGVSEGQFAEVMNSELKAVHKAYQRLTGTQAKPEVLFLLVQKRHHTRLFNVDQRTLSQNVEPGTVVDTHIVHARELDFYLVSHQAIKGTARPTRYHAVCNDGEIPHDEVEQLTYYLCHLYSRCMRAVSYPTPTYYAHLACLRARSLTYGEKFNNQALEQNPQRLQVLDKMLDFSRMFFV